MENRMFPVFLPVKGKKVIVFGGGKIASRRIKTLLEFDFDIKAVAPVFSKEIEELAVEGKLMLQKDFYRETYIEDQFMILACTNQRQVNREIGIRARERGILVSVCDSKEECNFFFPAIAVNHEVTVGIAGGGNTHHVTKRAAAAVRQVIKRKDY